MIKKFIYLMMMTSVMTLGLIACKATNRFTDYCDRIEELHLLLSDLYYYDFDEEDLKYEVVSSYAAVTQSFQNKRYDYYGYFINAVLKLDKEDIQE